MIFGGCTQINAEFGEGYGVVIAEPSFMHSARKVQISYNPVSNQIIPFGLNTLDVLERDPLPIFVPCFYKGLKFYGITRTQRNLGELNNLPIKWYLRELVMNPVFATTYCGFDHPGYGASRIRNSPIQSPGGPQGKKLRSQYQPCSLRKNHDSPLNSNGPQSTYSNPNSEGTYDSQKPVRPSFWRERFLPNIARLTISTGFILFGGRLVYITRMGCGWRHRKL
jgi:hypothetical protein